MKSTEVTHEEFFGNLNSRQRAILKDYARSILNEHRRESPYVVLYFYAYDLTPRELYFSSLSSASPMTLAGVLGHRDMHLLDENTMWLSPLVTLANLRRLL